jgi:hypothetical protein
MPEDLHSAVRLYLVEVLKTSSAGLSLEESRSQAISWIGVCSTPRYRFHYKSLCLQAGFTALSTAAAVHGHKGLRAESHKQLEDDHFKADSIHHKYLPHYLFHCNGTCHCRNLSFNLLTAMHRIEWVFEMSRSRHCLDDPHKQKGKTEL